MSPSPARATRLATLAIICGVVSISWSAIFVRWAEIPGVASAFYRVLIASLILSCIFSFSRRRRSHVATPVVALCCLAGVFFAADVTLYNVAVLHTSAGDATFLGNNAPLFVGLLTWVLSGSRPSTRFWIALTIATAGASLIVSIDWRHLPSASSADLLAVAASVCFALYLLATERLRKNMDAISVVTYSTTASAATVLLFSICTHNSLAIPGLRALYAVAGLALVCQLTGYFCLTYALRRLPATISSVVLLAVAPLTVCLAWLFFGETMSALQIVGGGLILVAIWLIATPQTVSEEGMSTPYVSS